MEWFKIVRFIIFVVVFIVGSSVTIYKVFATNARVDKIERNVVNTQNILCAMAIDFKWKKTMKACERLN